MTSETKDGKVVESTDPSLMLDEHSGVKPLAISPEMTQFLFEGTEIGEMDENDPYRRIINQILNAETPDAVLTPIEAKKLNEFIGVPLLYFGFSLQKSEYDVGTPTYAAMECQVAETHEPVVITTGHRKVLAQIVKLEQFNKYPYQIMPGARGTGQGGTPMLELLKWPDGYAPADSGDRSNPPF